MTSSTLRTTYSLGCVKANFSFPLLYHQLTGFWRCQHFNSLLIYRLQIATQPYDLNPKLDFNHFLFAHLE